MLLTTFLQILLTLSNTIALLPLISLYYHNRYFGSFLLSMILVAAILKHGSERKLKLPGLYLTRYARLFLRIYRFFAFVTFSYAIYLLLTNPNFKLQYIIMPAIGFIFLFKSEITYYRSQYILYHLIWHFIVYTSIYIIIH